MLKKGDYCVIVNDVDPSLIGKICTYLGNSQPQGYDQIFPCLVGFGQNVTTAVKEVREATAMDLALEGL
jgi:hypothetical protein